ncbi:hypothetical protein ACVII1_000133 [Bradyrhizobium elkanii]|jgi:hypothetical protein|uniref:Uncharacterized protein n=1 Tax=Bradyrhizobium elkanii TaxID=29448 RepID=A0ABV4EQU4_BRAEL|nr:hypothetical protein [Bradyrhizobium elkanii]MCP1758845.1 hypothetical protein [Bradyrhizobium elkanii]MCP1975851.1 hypothetical protein [Bradyrhizobium elkanii]MCP1985029.1 hypothetical protein [Bradyrhizobium elkanii]MCS3890604.1 hypothetical protein [Bradyrhizobium elkanii]
MTVAARLPDAASLETVLAGLGPASADADLIPALTVGLSRLRVRHRADR